MPRFFDQALSFFVNFHFEPTRLKTIISDRYDEIVSSYGLTGDEKIFNPWNIVISQDHIEISAIRSDKLDNVYDISIIPSLLIYLKIFGEMGNIIPSEFLLYYFDFITNTNRLLIIPENFPLNVIITTVYSSAAMDRLTFDIIDLDYRDFVIGRIVYFDTNPWIKERMDLIPKVSGLLPTPKESS
jgi:hypothetical protein